MRSKLFQFWVLMGLTSNLAIAHLPPPQVDDGSHPAGIIAGGPIKPRVSTDPGDYELVKHISPPSAYETTALFWGKRWQDKSYAGDEVAGLDQFYSGFESSSYSMQLLEYVPASQTKPGTPSLSIGYSGHIFDSEAISSAVDISQAADQVCFDINRGLIPSHNLKDGHYFSVFVDRRRPASTACAVVGNAGCPVNSQGVVISYFISLVYDSREDPDCDVRDRITNHSPALASAANQAARALSELFTDPDWTGWFDNNGEEVDDKCEWIFVLPFVTFADNSRWKLQSLWSNQAYESGTGHPNREGQPGCLTINAVRGSPGRP